MKTRVLFLFLAACLVALAARLVHEPNPIHADEVPEKYQGTVKKGLEYLVKNQHKDGHWEGDGGKHPAAMTALAGMALLMEGSNLHTGKYSVQIRKAAEWLMDKSQAKRGGLIYSEHPSETDRYMYGHGLAMLYLAWAYGNDNDQDRRKRIREILTRAVKYTANAQSSQGGWYRTSRVEGHDFDEVWATVIQLQGLHAAQNIGTEIPSAAANDGQEYLRVTLARREKDAKAEQIHSRRAEMAAALACRCNGAGFVNGYSNDEQCVKWLKVCKKEIAVGRDTKLGRDELLHYFYAQAVLNHTLNWSTAPLPNDVLGAVVSWGEYSPALFDRLKSSQNQDGSWPASDGISIGPVYATALWCTVLQLDKKTHPLTRKILVPTR